MFDVVGVRLVGRGGVLRGRVIHFASSLNEIIDSTRPFVDTHLSGDHMTINEAKGSADSPTVRSLNCRAQPLPYPFGEPSALDFDMRYSDLQEREPVCWVQLPYGEPGWLLTRYEDVRAVLNDARFSLSAAIGRNEPRMHSHTLGDERGILGMDPPEQTRLRRLVAQAFTPHRVKALRPRIQEIAHDLIDQMTLSGPPADLTEQFSRPLAITVICELLGVPYEDRRNIAQWALAFFTTSAFSEQETADRVVKLADYVMRIIAERRSRPAEDLLTGLVQARDDHGFLTEMELLHLSMAILVGGFETTATELSDFLYFLLTHADHKSQLLRSPELIPRAVDELLRHIPLGVAPIFARYATEDVVIRGQQLKAGEPVILPFLVANRDPSVFDNPHEVDFTRDLDSHLTFGYGPHHCLGAHLARAELEIGLATILGRLPQLRLDPGVDAVQWNAGLVTHGPSLLPVAW
ncbi:cytochrome P450 [Streptomyces sp. NPDC004126]|uniref:cytochrome P450 n=1 Tax=Streptomyces sp. NPDC004126 TaxID=3390695 RepID=UPI003D05DF36